MRDIDMERLLSVGLENIDNYKYNNFDFLTTEYKGIYFNGLICFGLDCDMCPLHCKNGMCIEFDSLDDFLEYEKAYKRFVDLKHSNEIHIDVNKEV